MAHETRSTPRTYFQNGREYTDHMIPGTCLIVTTETPRNPVPPLPAGVLADLVADPPQTGICDAGHCYCDNPYRCGWHR